ncbi:MAG: ABC transporter ATP-binding protein [Myxococcota bacterium]
MRLRARDLLVRRGDFELHIDDLEVRGGETLAVIGSNGAGKSTLLRALAGLETPLAGTVTRAVAGAVTLVFQRPIALDGDVAHNVRVALQHRRLARAAIERRVATALEHFGIAPLADRRAATLSGGELRRLALARAFALEPAVLLLDEPFDDLDPPGREALSLDLRLVIERTGVGVAVVTHELRRALLLCDRIAVLIEGRVAQVGLRAEVLDRPRTLEVARRVGMTNLIAGEVTPEGHALEVDGQHRIPLPRRLEGGRALCVGIRPEHLKVDVGRGEGTSIGKGTVRHSLSDGVVVSLLLDWAGRELRSHLLADRGLARSVRAGDRLSLSVRPEEVHPFEV